jgi:hypothetical protein
MQPFLIPDDFRAFLQRVVQYLDAPGDEPKLLDAEDALQDETGYGGRVDGAFRFTYISRDGRNRWTVPLSEAAIRDIADGLLIEVMGERFDLVRTTQREPKGHPLLIWGEYADDALVVRDRGELLAALDALHALGGAAPRMLRMWTAADDQIVAMTWRDDCALYVIESLDGYATSCGDHGRNDAFELVDYDGQPFAVPYHDCIPWPAARAALLRFVDHGDLGPEIRTEGRVPTALLMMGDADRSAVLAARAEPPRTVARSSLPRMLAPVPAERSPADTAEDLADPPDRWSTPTIKESLAPAPLAAEELSAWARRLIELLHASALIELGRANLDELSYQLGSLLQAHGAEAQRSLDTAEWLANEIGAVRGIDRMFATGGDLQIALRRSRTP